MSESLEYIEKSLPESKIDSGFKDTETAIKNTGVLQEGNSFDEGKEIQFMKSIQSYFNGIPGYRSYNIQETTSPETYENEKLIGLKYGDTWYYFDYYSESYIPGQDVSAINEYREKNLPKEISVILNGVEALDNLMQKNSQQGWEWSWKIRGEELGPEDTVDKTFFEYAGMDAKTIQMTIRNNIEIFNSNGGLSSLPKEITFKVEAQQRKYLEIVMGIGEEYEDGVAYFYKTEGEIDYYIESVIAMSGSIESCALYYQDIASRINENNRSSGKNKEAHSLFLEKLSQKIYEMIVWKLSPESEKKDDKNTLKQALMFVRVITGRGIYKMNDSSLYQTQIAEKVCLQILDRKNGVLDRLDANYTINFSDPLIGDMSPSNVVGKAISKLEGLGIPNVPSFLEGNLGIDMHLIVSENSTKVPVSYEEASLDQKGDLSLLIRIVNKIENGSLNPEAFAQLSPDEKSQKIMQISNEVYYDSLKAVKEMYDSTIGDSYSSYIESIKSISGELLPEEIECFELFGDIRGYDWFDMSDENQNTTSEGLKTLGVIISTIAVVMIATVVTGGLGGGAMLSVVVGASSGTAASIGFLDPRKFDSTQEMWSDIGTDLIVNSFHAAYMEKLTMKLWGGLSKSGKAKLLGIDLGSGIYLEGARDNVIGNIFRGEPLLGDSIKTIPETLSNSGFNSHSKNYYTRKVGLESKNPEIQQKLSEIEASFHEAAILYTAWNHETLNFENIPEFQNWFQTYMSDFHRQISKKGTLEFLDLVEKWSEEQIEKYSPKY